MKKIIISILITIVFIAMTTGCKKDESKVPRQKIEMKNVSMGKSDNFAVLAGSAVTSTGETNITGDIGLSPGTSVGGFPPGVITGNIRINDEITNQAKLDITVAYNDLAGRTSKDIMILSGNIGGLTLTPGLYKSTSSLEISSDDLTFDAKGDKNAVFIIQIASSLSTSPGRRVILKGNASSSNIFWQVTSAASFGTTSVFKGIIIALESITFDTGASLEGKALTRTGAVILDGNTIVKK